MNLNLFVDEEQEMRSYYNNLAFNAKFISEWLDPLDPMYIPAAGNMSAEYFYAWLDHHITTFEYPSLGRKFIMTYFVSYLQTGTWAQQHAAMMGLRHLGIMVEPEGCWETFAWRFGPAPLINIPTVQLIPRPIVTPEEVWYSCQQVRLDTIAMNRH